LSPLLFNLAVDALDHILEKAKKNSGLIKGLVPHLVSGGITHLQYTDDTIILVNNDRESIKNLKFLLYCFEWMSGLKINYHKSEMIAFGMSEERAQDIANALNCKIGQMPLKYLGFPISAKNLGVSAFKPMVDKMRKKLQPWKGKHLSSGAPYTH